MHNAIAAYVESDHLGRSGTFVGGGGQNAASAGLINIY